MTAPPTPGSRGDLSDAVTLLFVPGDRPDRFPKAASVGAGLVVCDLEDAVRAAAKEQSRGEVVSWVARGGRAAVRVNAPGTEHHHADLAALGAAGPGLAGVVVPMAETPSSLAEVVRALQGVPVLALIETARGVRAAPELAAVDGVVRLGIGHLDLAAALGADPDAPVIDHCRHQLVLAARAAGSAAPVDGVTLEVADTGRITADATRARRDGYGGKLCIHPAQLAPVAAAFTPSDAEIAWARRVREAFAEGVALVDGAMVDAPVIARARSVLASAKGAR